MSQNTQFMIAGAITNGYRYASVTTAGKTFETSLPMLIMQITFTADSTAAITADIQVEGQYVNGGGAMLIRALCTEPGGVAPADWDTIIWRPVRPFKWNAGMPFTVTPSAEVGVTIMAIPDPNP